VRSHPRAGRPLLFRALCRDPRERCDLHDPRRPAGSTPACRRRRQGAGGFHRVPHVEIELFLVSFQPVACRLVASVVCQDVSSRSRSTVCATSWLRLPADAADGDVPALSRRRGLLRRGLRKGDGSGRPGQDDRRPAHAAAQDNLRQSAKWTEFSCRWRQVRRPTLGVSVASRPSRLQDGASLARAWSPVGPGTQSSILTCLACALSGFVGMSKICIVSREVRPFSLLWTGPCAQRRSRSLQRPEAAKK
jgi:hypothetical protein